MRRAPWERIVARIVLYLAVLVGALFFAGPFFWTVASSLKTWWEIGAFPPTFLPKVVQWGNYVEVFQRAPMARWIVNSLLVDTLELFLYKSWGRLLQKGIGEESPHGAKDSR
jgi:ABC-type glycerol-3-phosphate transport system permease component